MSPAFPVVSGGEIAAALRRAGFVEVGQRGSHLKLRDQAGRTVVVPLHEELARGTLSSILRQAGLGVEDLLTLLDRRTDRQTP